MPGQTDVDDDEVVAGGRRAEQCGLAVGDAIDGVALALERPRERDANPLVVLDDQQPGHRPIVSGRSEVAADVTETFAEP